MTLWLGLGWSVTLGSVAVLLGVLAWMLFHRQRTRERLEAASDEMTVEYSAQRYRVMERLLLREDLEFLEAQPGYRPAMGAQWKREQRHIFRLYLGDLKQDFRQLHAQARALVAESNAHGDAASGDLVHLLLRQQITFLRATTLLELRLLLQALGICRVDVRPFLAMVEAMRMDLNLRTLRTEMQFG